jgi:hypothetical protein
MNPDDFFLTHAEALRLIMAVDPAKKEIPVETVLTGIHDAALGYAFEEETRRPDASARVTDATKLASACRDVLVKLGIAPLGRSADKGARKPVEWRSIKRTLGAGALYTVPTALDAIRAVQNLERWAENIAEHYRQKPSKKKAGAPKRNALGALFESLEGLYSQLWDDVPTLRTSRYTGTIREADATEGDGSVLARVYEKGDKLPLGFLRFLSELFPLLTKRGLVDLPDNPVAIEKAVRRWWDEPYSGSVIPVLRSASKKR